MAQSQPQETVGDRLWVWGQAAGVYNDTFLPPGSKKSTIEPVSAAHYMGIRNMIFVRYEGKPKLPFQTYYEPFKKLDRVYWSLVGTGGVTSAEEREHVYKLAEDNDNIAGFILDDFFHTNHIHRPNDAISEPLMASLSPAQLRELRSRGVREKWLPVMAVVYTGQISPRAKAHLDEVDEVCMWTWRSEDLKDLKSNFEDLEELIPAKPIFLGCYLFDLSAQRPIPVELMNEQTNLGYKWLKADRIQGMIFLGTPNVDVGLESVEWTREWIANVADEPLKTK